MKTNLKKVVIAGVMTAIISASAFASVNAATLRINFDHIDVFDDGDNKPHGAGEITFLISLNGRKIYKKHKVVSDKGNKVVELNFSKEANVFGNSKISLRVRGTEHDDNSGNENCWGKVSHGLNQLGEHTLKCGSGDMGYNLHYYVERIN